MDHIDDQAYSPPSSVQSFGLTLDGPLSAPVMSPRFNRPHPYLTPPSPASGHPPLQSNSISAHPFMFEYPSVSSPLIYNMNQAAFHMSNGSMGIPLVMSHRLSMPNRSCPLPINPSNIASGYLLALQDSMQLSESIPSPYMENLALNSPNTSTTPPIPSATVSDSFDGSNQNIQDSLLSLTSGLNDAMFRQNTYHAPSSGVWQFITSTRPRTDSSVTYPGTLKDEQEFDPIFSIQQSIIPSNGHSSNDHLSNNHTRTGPGLPRRNSLASPIGQQ